MNFIVKKAEVIGLCILLGAFCWQSIEDYLRTESDATEQIVLSEKIENLWSMEKMICEKIECYHTEGSSALVVQNVDAFMRKNDSAAIINTQRKFTGMIRIILYILGSILVIIGKMFEKKGCVLSMESKK